MRGVTKRCRLSWLANSALVDEPECGEGFAGSQPMSTVPEIIDPVFTKTSQNARFLLSENERFGLVFVKTGSINSGTAVHRSPNKLWRFNFIFNLWMGG